MWKEAVEKFKKIDLMVNNAGIMNDNLVQKTIDVNLVNPCFLSRIVKIDIKLKGGFMYK